MQFHRMIGHSRNARTIFLPPHPRSVILSEVEGPAVALIIGCSPLANPKTLVILSAAKNLLLRLLLPLLLR
jgi:hypothetical protein